MMAVNVVTPGNLGADLDVGTLEPNKINVKRLVGATALAAGVAGVAPAPAAGDEAKFLAGDGTWRAPDDFWRSGVGGTDWPDGVHDPIDNIRHDGKVGIGMDALADLHVKGSFATEYLSPVEIGGSGMIPDTTSLFGVWDGWWTSPLTLPATGVLGQRMIILSGASFDTVINVANTSMAAPLTLVNGQAVEFVFNYYVWARIE